MVPRRTITLPKDSWGTHIFWCVCSSCIGATLFVWYLDVFLPRGDFADFRFNNIINFFSILHILRLYDRGEMLHEKDLCDYHVPHASCSTPRYRWVQLGWITERIYEEFTRPLWVSLSQDTVTGHSHAFHCRLKVAYSESHFTWKWRGGWMCFCKWWGQGVRQWRCFCL